MRHLFVAFVEIIFVHANAFPVLTWNGRYIKICSMFASTNVRRRDQLFSFQAGNVEE